LVSLLGARAGLLTDLQHLEKKARDTANGDGHQRIGVAPDLDLISVRFGNDPVDTVAPKEWEALSVAVAEALGEPDVPGSGKGGGGGRERRP